jgi:hypothetical protein
MSNFMKIHQVGFICSMRTDRRDEANIALCNFANAPKNELLYLIATLVGPIFAILDQKIQTLPNAAVVTFRKDGRKSELSVHVVNYACIPGTSDYS